MLRSAASKVMWVGRATVFLVGLAVILALLFGVASTALGNTGGQFILGRANTADATSSLVTTITDPLKAAQAALVVQQKSGGPAIDLRVNSGKAPMKVNSQTKVINLNADQLDGLSSANLLPSSTYVKTETMPLTDGGANSTLLYCSSPSDRVLGGGFSKGDTVEVNSSNPYVNPSDSGGQGWSVNAKDRSVDGNGPSVTVYVLCADFPPAHIP